MCNVNLRAILIDTQLNQYNQYGDQLCGDTDDAAVQFMVSFAIFSASHPSVQVQRINSTEELALPPPPTCCLKHNANLMNHEHILRLSLCDPLVPCLQRSGRIQ